jgi:tripartite-type tricarboxylate transporter receptor subunit TctC
MRKLLSTALAATLLTSGAFVAPALAEYPEKPVSFIVPWPPGDLEDVLTRMVADDFQAKYGVAAAVVNKPGGGGGPFPGAVAVATAPADGYTVGSFVISVPIVGPNIGIPELSPNPFDPLGIFLTYPFVIVAGEDAPYDDMAGLAAYAQDHDIALGHFGAPLPPTKVTLALAKEMGFEWASDAAFDALDCNTLASGDVDVMNTTLQLVLPCLDKVKVLASVTGERISLIPDTPTVAEIVPALKLALWNGLFIHKDTPADIRAKIVEVARATMASDRAQEVAKNTGAQIYWKDAEASAAQIAEDTVTLATIDGILN